MRPVLADRPPNQQAAWNCDDIIPLTGAKPTMKELTKAINAHLALAVQASHTDLAMALWLEQKVLAHVKGTRGLAAG